MFTLLFWLKDSFEFLTCCMMSFSLIKDAPARTVGWRDPGFFHTSFLQNLWPNSVYVSMVKAQSEPLLKSWSCTLRIVTWVSTGIRTEWAIACLVDHIFGARAIHSSHHPILEKNHYSVSLYLVTWGRYHTFF